MVQHTCVNNQCNHIFSSGNYRDVGLAGHALCGGFGTFGRKLGYLGEQIIEMEVVLVNGTVVKVSRNENTELFTLLRGACSVAFGVVVSFKIRLHYMKDGLVSKVYIAAPTEPDQLVEAVQWFTSYGPISPDIWTMIWNMKKTNFGGNCLGSRKKCQQLLWTDEGLKRLAQINGYNSTADDPPSAWISEKSIYDFLLNTYGGYGSTLDELLQVTGPHADGYSYYSEALLFPLTLPSYSPFSLFLSLSPLTLPLPLPLLLPFPIPL